MTLTYPPVLAGEACPGYCGYNPTYGNPNPNPNPNPNTAAAGDAGNDNNYNLGVCGPCLAGSRAAPLIMPGSVGASAGGDGAAYLRGGGGGGLCTPCPAGPNAYGTIFLVVSILLVIVVRLPSGLFDAIKKHRLCGNNSNSSGNDSSRGNDTSRQRLCATLWLYTALAFETAAAVLITVLVLEPRGALWVRSCGMQSIDDWYAPAADPAAPGQPLEGSVGAIATTATTLRCASEVAYPLVSFVPIFDALTLAMVLFADVPIRYVLKARFGHSGDTRYRTTYATLFFLPAHAIGHVVLGGLFYYAFPYIILTFHLITTMSDMAEAGSWFIGQSVPHTAFLVFNYLLAVLGLASLWVFYDSAQPHLHFWHIAWVVLGATLPVLLNWATFKLTNPMRFDFVSS
eukprot:UC1_evm3s1677